MDALVQVDDFRPDNKTTGGCLAVDGMRNEVGCLCSWLWLYCIDSDMPAASYAYARVCHSQDSIQTPAMPDDTDTICARDTAETP